MTGPRGGETTTTEGGLIRTTVSLDEVTLRRLDAEVRILRQGGAAQVSRSAVIRRLARNLPLPPK